MRGCLISIAWICVSGFAQADFTEDFNGGWNDPSYSSGDNPSTFNATTGIWENNNALISDDKARSGDYVRFNSATGSYLEYKGLDGNGHDGGIDSISFYYRHWDGDGKTIDFSLEYNIDNAGWTTAATGSTSTETTYQLFTHNLGFADDNIRLRIITTAAPERLLIDDFSLTSGGGNPPPPGISFQSSTSTASEGDGTLTIPVTITPPAAGSVSVSVTGGSVAANDYSLNTSSLNFTTANPTQNISLTLTDDSVVEANETLILTLSSPVGANLGDVEHTLTITDNDAAPPSGETLVIVSANTTSGNFQQYEGPGDRIFQALDPDIVGIQEFNVPGDDLRGWVDVTFGPEFHFSIEPGDEQIPNGVISRYPITASGEFIDPEVSNRDFAWATIDIPGDIDLHVISVHFLTSNSSDRSAQAANLINNINTTFPSTDYIVLCGDFNTTSRSSNEVNTLKQVFSDTHVPVDQNNNSDTNANRNNPYDWVMPNTTLDALHTTYTLNGVDFPDGLVFDTRVWPSNNVPSPALANDSGASQMQHMAIIKAFTLPDIPPPVTETSRGTPYAWLQSFGITSDFENAEELDHDGDGYFTWEEYLSNTSPVDPVSRFRILSIQPSGGTVAIVCETQPGRHYEIEFAEAPAPGQPLSWLPFASAAAGEFTETAGNTSSHGFSDDFSSSTSGGEPTGASRFYRVRVSLP